jgi:hypothetical protein
MNMKTRCFLLSLSVITLLGLVVASARAGSDSDQGATNWGKSVKGVQLLITLATNVFQVGSSSTVESSIINSSTNAITVDISAPTIHFDVLLISETGKLYHITTPLAIRELSLPVMINPGEEKSESIPVTFGVTRFGDAVEPGDYTLKAKRTFSSSDGNFTLESNSIKVKIIK